MFGKPNFRKVTARVSRIENCGNEDSQWTRSCGAIILERSVPCMVI